MGLKITGNVLAINITLISDRIHIMPYLLGIIYLAFY